MENQQQNSPGFNLESSDNPITPNLSGQSITPTTPPSAPLVNISPSPAPTTTNTTPQPPPKNQKRTAILLLIAVVGLLLVGALVWLVIVKLNPSSPDTIANEQTENAEVNDEQSASNLTNDSSKQENSTSVNNKQVVTNKTVTLNEVGFTIDISENYTPSEARQGSQTYRSPNGTFTFTTSPGGFYGSHGSVSYMLDSDFEVTTPQLLAIEFFSAPITTAFLAQENIDNQDDLGMKTNEAKNTHIGVVDGLETSAQQIASSPLRWTVDSNIINSPYDLDFYTHRFDETSDSTTAESDEEDSLEPDDWRDGWWIIRYYTTEVDDTVVVAAVATGLNYMDHYQDILEEYRSEGNDKEPNELVLERFGKNAVAQADALVAALNITKIQ